MKWKLNWNLIDLNQNWNEDLVENEKWNKTGCGLCHVSFCKPAKKFLMKKRFQTLSLFT